MTQQQYDDLQKQIDLWVSLSNKQTDKVYPSEYNNNQYTNTLPISYTSRNQK